ncbi:MAG: multiheme c-type cytochrome [Planctomycetota bacterium]
MNETKRPSPSDPHSSTRPTPSPQELSRSGWASPLAIVVSAWIFVEGVTGLWIYLAPFSVSAQVQVLLHTVLGLLFLGPYLYYQVRHWLVWYRQKMSAAMVLGYALMISLLVSAVSGILLTWQAAFGPKIQRLWDLVHLVSGISALGLLISHLALAWLRRRGTLGKAPELAHAQWRFALGSLVSVLTVAIAIGGLAVALKGKDHRLSAPDGYSLPKYAQQFDEYRGNPFAPSFATTEGQEFLDPDLLAHSASCGTSGCHEQILAEWEPSAHRFSAMNPPFQQVQQNFAADREPAETRYCAGCHDPISLFAGAKDIHNLDLSAPGMQEGISCVACHAISKVDQRGNADYALTPPEKYLWESTTGLGKFLSDFLIRAYPRQHLVDYDRNVLRTPEYCGACHKQFIPEALNRFGFVEGQNQYDEWRKSHWNSDDPEKNLSCRDCHMRLVADSTDPGHGEGGDRRRSEKDGAHRHHGFIAANVFMPELLDLPGWEKHVALTQEWIRGETVLPEIADVYPEGPVTSLQIHGPESIRAGEELSLRIVITNRKAGHNYITGPLDFIRSWIHLRVADVHGTVLGEWGALDPEARKILDRPGELHELGNARDEGTLVLEALPINERGELIMKHELWTKAGGKGKRVIFPKYSDSQVFRFVVPEGTEGPLQITADLQYRRYRQDFLDQALPGLEAEHGVLQPTVTQSSDRRLVQIDGAPASTPMDEEGGK